MDGPLLGAPSQESASPPETFRVLSYNIHMWQPSLEDLAGVIRESGADIIGLNEAWTGSKNEQLAKELGYHVVYGGEDPDREHPREPHTINGFFMPQVLLTKHKVVRSRTFNAMAKKEHPAFDPEVPIYRGGILVELETARGSRLQVFVLHLHPWGDGDNEKMTTMRLEEIKGILGTLGSEPSIPTLLIGDFNSRSHQDATGGWKVSQRLEKAGFRDLYRSVHPDSKANPGLTCGDGRIDYVFHDSRFEGVDCKVVTRGVFGSEGYDHSDHLAVWGEVRLKPPEPSDDEAGR